MSFKIYIPIVLLITIKYSNEYGNWNPHRRPRMMGDAIPLNGLNTNRKRVQHKIVVFHNFFRSKVKPTASNMLKMKWHKGAAKAAQRWADACKFLTHDTTAGRYIYNYGACGQNIFIATQKVPWLFAIKTWWLEKDLFTFGKPHNNFTIIGHYTQMVWAASHQVGCGISKCYTGSSSNRRVFYNYVCNYCPAGNLPTKIHRPYKVGKPCGLCKEYCRGKLCLNACSSANMWSNCERLYKAHPHWLCHTIENFANCKATCTCRHRIHD